MVIEWLRYEVEPQAREKFVELDHQIWTLALAEQSGFLGKEVWITPDVEDEVSLIIKWESREHWSAVPADVVEKTDAEFKQAMGDSRYRMLKGGEYHVRKFFIR